MGVTTACDVMGGMEKKREENGKGKGCDNTRV